MDYPWEIGAATGIGSVPWTDRDEAVRIVMGEAPLLPHLPELPGRGAGSDLIGRSASLLVDIHVDLQPAGWRVVDAAGADERRARSALAADVDALEIGAYGYDGPLKVQSAGPLTLAAGLEQSRGDRMLSDYGARRDLAESLAEGLARHVDAVSSRIPGAQVILQIDEPSLPAVLGGGIPTISGFGRLRAVSEDEVESLVRTVVEAVGVPVVVHSCAAEFPTAVVRRAGAMAVAVDVDRLGRVDVEALAAAVDEGMAVWFGVVATSRPEGAAPSDADLARRVVDLWRRMDRDPASMVDRTVITPACGLARTDHGWARQAYALTGNVARAFADLVRTAT